MFWVGPVPVSWKKNKEEAKMIKRFVTVSWKENEAERQRGFTEKPYHCLCVNANSVIFDPLLHASISYISQ